MAIKVETKKLDRPLGATAADQWANDSLEQTGRFGRMLDGAGVTGDVLEHLNRDHMPTNPNLRVALTRIVGIAMLALQGRLTRAQLLEGQAALQTMNAMPDLSWRKPWGRLLGCYLTARLAVLECPDVKLPPPGAL